MSSTICSGQITPEGCNYGGTRDFDLVYIERNFIISQEDIIYHLENISALYSDEGYDLNLKFLQNRNDTLNFKIEYNKGKSKINSILRIRHFQDSIAFSYSNTTFSNIDTSTSMLSYYAIDEQFQIDQSLVYIIPKRKKDELFKIFQSPDSIRFFSLEHVNPRYASGGSDYMVYDINLIDSVTFVPNKKERKLFNQVSRVGFKDEYSTCLCDEPLSQYALKIYLDSKVFHLSAFNDNGLTYFQVLLDNNLYHCHLGEKTYVKLKERLLNRL